MAMNIVYFMTRSQHKALTNTIYASVILHMVTYASPRSQVNGCTSRSNATFYLLYQEIYNTKKYERGVFDFHGPAVNLQLALKQQTSMLIMEEVEIRRVPSAVNPDEGALMPSHTWSMPM